MEGPQSRTHSGWLHTAELAVPADPQSFSILSEAHSQAAKLEADSEAQRASYKSKVKSGTSVRLNKSLLKT